MGVLLGDTTGNGLVNASDVSLTKSRSGQVVDATNYYTDVTVSNSINASDVSLVKSEKSGAALALKNFLRAIVAGSKRRFRLGS